MCREAAWTELAVSVTLVVAFQSWSRGKKDDVMAEGISAIFVCIAIKINHLLCRWSPVSFSFKQETSSVIIGAGSPTALQITKEVSKWTKTV